MADGESPPIVSADVLKAELGHLREYMGIRFDGLAEKVGAVDKKVDATCTAVEDLEDQVKANAHALDMHDTRLTHLEKFQAGLLSAALKWGSLGAGVAITAIVIVLAVAKARGWW